MDPFKSLMALASKQTEASQAALAKETQHRLAREKAKRLGEERKEMERLRLEKERIAKQKIEDEKREQRLAAERLKRQADREAAASAAAKTKQDDAPRASGGSRGPRPHGSPRGRPNGRSTHSAPVTKDPEELRRLEREEKEARAKARLFGEPVSAHKKVGIKAGLTNRQRTMGKGPQKPSALGMSRPQPSTNSSAPMTARQRIEHQFLTGERKPLSQTKRDCRTIEEIEQGMKRKKMLNGDFYHSTVPCKREITVTSRAVTGKPIASQRSHMGSSSLNGTGALKDSSNSEHVERTGQVAPSRTGGSRTPIGLNRIGSRPQPASAPRLHSRCTASNGDRDSCDTDSEEEYDDEGDGDRTEDESVVPGALRDEIWKIMGKDRKRYASRMMISDEEESDDMEAGADEVLKEEGRAARLAKLEDQREQDALRRHELEKKKRLAQSRLEK